MSGPVLGARETTATGGLSPPPFETNGLERPPRLTIVQRFCDARKHRDERLLSPPLSGAVSPGETMPGMKFEECLATEQVKKIPGKRKTSITQREPRENVAV